MNWNDVLEVFARLMVGCRMAEFSRTKTGYGIVKAARHNTLGLTVTWIDSASAEHTNLFIPSTWNPKEFPLINNGFSLDRFNDWSDYPNESPADVYKVEFYFA